MECATQSTYADFRVCNPGRAVPRNSALLRASRPAASAGEADGRSHPYQVFGEQDFGTARHIRVGQALGLSLREIAEAMEKYREGRLPLSQRIAMMKNQLARLETRMAELEQVKAYVCAKIAWQEQDEQGPEPTLA